MNLLSKILLWTSLPTLALGVFISFTTIPLSPVWTFVLPNGVALFGLFLIARVWQSELFDSQKKNQTKSPSLEEQKTSPSGRPPVMTHRAAYGLR